MEVLDKKVQEVPTLANPPIKVESNVSLNAKDEASEKIAENGNIDNASKKEVKNDIKLETANSNKQTETAAGKHNNVIL